MEKILKSYRFYIFICLIICCITFLPITRCAMVRNVFDEMYYSAHETYWLPLTNAEFLYPLYEFQGQRNLFDFKRIDMFNMINATRTTTNKDSKSVTVSWSLDRKTQNFGMVREKLYINNESIYKIVIYAAYTPETKILTFERPFVVVESGTLNSTRLENKEAFKFLNEQHVTTDYLREQYELLIHDYILTDWFSMNGNKSRFSMDNLGEFTEVWEEW